MNPEPLEIFKLREKGIAIGKEVKVIKLSDLKFRVEWLKIELHKKSNWKLQDLMDKIYEAFEDVTK